MRKPTLRTAIGAAAMAATVLVAPGVGLASSTEAFAVTKLTHAQATSRLTSSHITWSSSGGCSDRNNPTCTSFEQVNLATIQGAQTLKSASGCALNITGGTEVGHASGTFSHFNGYKLDYGLNSCINGYITGNFAFIGLRSDGAKQYKSGSGNIYALENGTHWDVTYFNCGGC